MSCCCAVACCSVFAGSLGAEIESIVAALLLVLTVLLLDQLELKLSPLLLCCCCVVAGSIVDEIVSVAVAMLLVVAALFWVNWS